MNNMETKESKIYQPQQVEIFRSKINFANYNPRKISDKARNLLKKNLKKVGLLGGVVFNKTTGNLISGHQRVSIIDEVNHYNPETKENDYTLRVEMVEMDEKSEKEQNIFMNNKNVQGEFEDDMLRELLQGIDYENAGLEEFDLQCLGVGDQTPIEVNYQPWNKSEQIGGNLEDGEQKSSEQEFLTKVDETSKLLPENRNLDRSIAFSEDTPENQIIRHNEIQKIKDRIAKGTTTDNDNGLLSYIVINFDSPREKEHFLEEFRISPDIKFLDGIRFLNTINDGIPYEESDTTEETEKTE